MVGDFEQGYANQMSVQCPECQHIGLLGETHPARVELERLAKIVDQPDPHDFMLATEAEARYQRMRWGENGDAGKNDGDWLWLLGALAAKALHNPDGDLAKKLHRITTIAAAACNWHAAVLNRSDTRPEIDAP